MSYRIFTDASADMSEELMRDVPAVDVIPMDVTIGGEPHVYGPGGDLDVKGFYALQRQGQFASTSQINPEVYRRAFRPVLEGVSLAEPDVVQWIQQSLQEEIEPILGGIMR